MAGCVGLSFRERPATLVVFIIHSPLPRYYDAGEPGPSVHSFIAEDPSNPYKNALPASMKYNHKCWVLSYHTSHHAKPSMHWTEHPVYFRKNASGYVDNDAIVFDRIHFSCIHLSHHETLHDLLARHFNIGERYQSEEEVAFLKERTKKILI